MKRNFKSVNKKASFTDAFYMCIKGVRVNMTTLDAHIKT